MGLNRGLTQDRGMHSASDAVNLTMQGVGKTGALSALQAKKQAGRTYCDKERVFIIAAVASCESAGKLREQIG